jgi:hypothetical protein
MKTIEKQYLKNKILFIIIMVLYECFTCNYKTHLKGNYDQHLNTRKHQRNIKKNNEFKMSTNEHKMSSNEHKMSTKEHKMSTKEHKMSSNEHKISTYECEHCGIVLKSKPILSRHQKMYCKILKKKNENFILKEKINELEKEKKLYEKEKKELYKKIDNLISKVGNTYNQNIILNNYGNEDLSHITDKFKTQLLKIPYVMIPKLIEAVHFNNEKPENNNIALTNKKDNRLMVFKDNKWIHQNKKEVISDLMDSNYFILDDHYDIKMNELNDHCQGNYIKFRQFMKEGDKELIEKLKSECENVLLDNRV